MREPEIESIMRQFITTDFLNRTTVAKLTNDDSLIDKGVIDSTGVLEMVAFIENRFDFRVEDDELIPQNLDSINRLKTYIIAKLKNRTTAGD